jgi:hypothetical protein
MLGSTSTLSIDEQ